jgi:hypothetical protein
MDSLVVEESRIEDRAGSLDLTELLALLFLNLFVVAFVLVGTGHWLGAPAFVRGHWAGAALLGLAALSTLISLARQLPWQNVVLSAVLIVLSGAGAGVVVISIASGMGSSRGGQAVGESFLLSKLWLWSLMWLVSILNCRGAVRLVLRYWRSAPSYGFWVLGGTVVLAVPLILSFARFNLVQPYWATALSALGTTIGTLVTLVLATPSFINKKPVKGKVDWHPLVIWVAFNLWFVVDAVGQGGWIVAGLMLSEILAVALFLSRGRGTRAVGQSQGEVHLSEKDNRQ